MGTVYPELEKEIDISWSQQYVFLAYVGTCLLTLEGSCLNSGNPTLFSITGMNVYTITVLWEANPSALTITTLWGIICDETDRGICASQQGELDCLCGAFIAG